MQFLFNSNSGAPRAEGARALSPIAKKQRESHECEKFWFGYDVTCPSVHRTPVRKQSHNANAPVFVWREVAWRDVFTTEMLKNKKCKVNLYVFVGYVDKRAKERKREKKKTEKRRRLSKVQRERKRQIASYSRPTGKVSLKKPHICLFHPFVISYGNF